MRLATLEKKYRISKWSMFLDLKLSSACFQSKKKDGICIT